MSSVVEKAIKKAKSAHDKHQSYLNRKPVTYTMHHIIKCIDVKNGGTTYLTDTTNHDRPPMFGSYDYQVEFKKDIDKAHKFSEMGPHNTSGLSFARRYLNKKLSGREIYGDAIVIVAVIYTDGECSYVDVDHESLKNIVLCNIYESYNSSANVAKRMRANK